jgi:hypothetical protein
LLIAQSYAGLILLIFGVTQRIYLSPRGLEDSSTLGGAVIVLVRLGFMVLEPGFSLKAKSTQVRSTPRYT